MKRPPTHPLTGLILVVLFQEHRSQKAAQSIVELFTFRNLMRLWFYKLRLALYLRLGRRTAPAPERATNDKKIALEQPLQVGDATKRYADLLESQYRTLVFGPYFAEDTVVKPESGLDAE